MIDDASGIDVCQRLQGHAVAADLPRTPSPAGAQAGEGRGEGVSARVRVSKRERPGPNDRMASGHLRR